MTHDLMLRFDTEAAAVAALPALRGEDGWLTASHTHALDVIGPVVTPAVVDGRFHANLRTDDPDLIAAAEPFAVNPPNPVRIWA